MTLKTRFDEDWKRMSGLYRAAKTRERKAELRGDKRAASQARDSQDKWSHAMRQLEKTGDQNFTRQEGGLHA